MATKTKKPKNKGNSNVVPFPIKNEIIQYRRTHRYSGYNDGLMMNPDRVLETNGGRVDEYLLDIYDRILRKDAHLFSLFQTRKHLILGKGFEILPASEEKRDIEICDFIKYQIYDHIENFQQDLLELLSALHYGYSVSEIITTVKNGKLMVDKLKFKHPNHFTFNDEGRLVWISKLTALEELLPKEKFIIHRHGGHDENPFGESLISERVFWLYWFKKNIKEFFMSYIERFGSPIPVFKYPTNLKKEDHAVIDEMMANFHHEMAIKVQEKVMPELLEWNSSGNRPIHEDAMKFFNAEMSKAVLGQTLTSETQDTGSKAQSSVHMDVLDAIITFDCINLDATINNQLIKPLVNWNYDNVERYPHIKSKVEKEEDLEKRAKIDEINAKYYKIPKQYYQDKYGYPPEEDIEDIKEDKEIKKDDIKEEDNANTRVDDKDTGESASGQKDGDSDPLLLQNEEGEIGQKDFSDEGMDDDRPVALHFEEVDRIIDTALEQYIKEQDKINKQIKKTALEASKPESLFKKLKKAVGMGVNQSLDLTAVSKVLTDAVFYSYYLGQSHVDAESDSLDFADNSVIEYTAAVKYFKDKLPVTPDEFANNYEKLHDKYFTISGVDNKNLLTGTQNLIRKGLKKGTSFKDIKKNIDHLFDQQGYTRLNPYHLETVIKTNILEAYREGKKARLRTPEMQKRFPYWKYSAVMDRRTRPSHAKLHGKVEPSNSAFWSSRPGGFNCRCTIIPLDKGYFKRKGLPEPKEGEHTFIFKNREEYDQDQSGNPVLGKITKGKKGWVSQTISNDKYTLDKPDLGFDKNLSIFDLTAQHNKANQKLNLSKTDSWKIKDVQELTNLLQTNYPKESYKKAFSVKGLKFEVPRSINTKDYPVLETYKKIIKAYFNNFGKFDLIKNFKGFRFVPEQVGRYIGDFRTGTINATHSKAEDLVYLYLRTDGSTEMNLIKTLNHEMGHQTYFNIYDLILDLPNEELFAQSMEYFFIGLTERSKKALLQLKAKASIPDEVMNKVFKKLGI